jgi:hypothetical protein
MKKIYVSIFVCLFAFNLGAQENILIYKEGELIDLSSGATPLTINAPSSATFDITFEVHNNSAINQKWRITRKKINVPPSWADGLCWGHYTDPFGGACYSSTQMLSNPWTSPGGAAVLFDILPGEYGKMKPDFNPADGTSGSAHYRYYITNSSGISYLDSVDVIVDYTAKVKPVKDPVTISLIPNPADNYLQINVSNSSSMNFKIVDVMGSVVMRDVVQGSRKLNVSDFNSGVYYVYFDGPGIKPFSRKVIIRH